MPGLSIKNGDMMAGVTGRIEEDQLASGKRDTKFVRRLDDARLVHRQDVAIELAHRLLAIDRRRAGDQLGRIGHVAGAARVHREPRIGQFTHQQPGATGVIKMDVGENDPVDLLRRNALGGQRRDHARHRMIGAGVNDGGAPALNHDMDGIQCRTDIVRIHGADAECVINNGFHRRHSNVSC